MSIQDWVAANLLPIALTIAAAIVINQFGGALLANLIKRTLRRYLKAEATERDIKKRQRTLIGITKAILKVAVWAMAILSILSRFGIDITPLVAGVGVAGFAIAFGAQSLIKDFVSGVFIIIENQYRVGDVVTLDNATGTVERITVRTTVVRDEEGSVHYIPNGSINHSINKTMGYAKINLSLGVKPKTDIDKLVEIINDVGRKLYEDEKWSKKLLDAPRFLNIGNFNDSAIEVKVTGKTKPSSQWAVTGELRQRLLAALKRSNIELAVAPTQAPAGKKK